QIVILRAGVINHIVSVIGLACMGGNQVINPQAQTVVGVGRLITLPVGTLHQTVGSIVHEGLRCLLAGFCSAVTTGIIGVGIVFVVGRGLAYELVQFVVLIVYTLVLVSFKYQIAQSIVRIIGNDLCDVAGHHTVQLIVGVDVSTAVGLVCLLVVLILGSGIFGLVRLVRVFGLVNLIATVQTRRHIAAIVDDGAVLVLMLARRNLSVSIAVTFNGGIFFAGLRLGGRFFRRGVGGRRFGLGGQLQQGF